MCANLFSLIRNSRSPALTPTRLERKRTTELAQSKPLSGSLAEPKAAFAAHFSMAQHSLCMHNKTQHTPISGT